MLDMRRQHTRAEMIEALRALADSGGVDRLLVRAAADEIRALNAECIRRIEMQDATFIGGSA